MPRHLFVRVRDKGTGHEFDVYEDHPWLTSGRVERIKPRTYPPSARERRPKHHLDLAARPVPRLPKSSGEGVATEKENTNG